MTDEFRRRRGGKRIAIALLMLGLALLASSTVAFEMDADVEAVLGQNSMYKLELNTAAGLGGIVASAGIIGLLRVNWKLSISRRR